MGRYLEVERSSLHTWMRILARTYLVLTPSRRQDHSRRKLAVVWASGVTLDLALLYWMRRWPERDATWSRLALNTADMAWWSTFGPDGRFDSGTSVIGVPLIAETVVRRGVPRAALAVGLSGAAIATIQRRRRRPVHLRSYRWQALAIVTGQALRQYAERHFRQRAGERAEALEADWNEAYRAGQRNVAAAVDGVSDYLGRLRSWLPDERELLERAADVRAVRGQRMDSTVYLRELVLEWAAMHNQGCQFSARDGWRDPEGPVSLHRFMVTETRITPADGLLKVAAPQATELTARLEASARAFFGAGAGPLDVAVATPPRARGAPFVLLVNGRSLEVGSADEVSGAVSRLLVRLRLAALDQLPPYDPVAATFILGAGWQLNTMTSSGFKVPLRWGLPIALITLIAGIDVHRYIGAHVEPDPMFAVERSLWVAAIGTLVIALTMRSDTKTDGARLIPGLEELELPALVATMNWGELDRRQRVTALAAMAGVSLLGQVAPRCLGRRRFPEPRLVDYVIDVLWPMMGIGPIRTARRTLAREERRLQGLFPVEQRYVQAVAELAGTEDLARDAIAVFEEATTLIGEPVDPEERRLRSLAHRDVRRIQAQVAGLGHEVDARLLAYRRRSGAGGATPHLVASTVRDALALADELGDVVVLDVENTLTGYKPTFDEYEAALRRVIDVVQRGTALRRVFVVSNARVPVSALGGGDVKVTVVGRARKPWIELPPLRRYRDELAGATVCGDQLVTDGMLARRLGGAFVELRAAFPRQPRGEEPAWPRLLRSVGERLVRDRFSPPPHGGGQLDGDLAADGAFGPNPSRSS